MQRLFSNPMNMQSGKRIVTATATSKIQKIQKDNIVSVITTKGIILIFNMILPTRK